jgi:hypothetical protein
MFLTFTKTPEPQGRFPWWARLFQELFPFGGLVTPSAPVDPVVEIGLPGSTPRKDTSMISAYYLSFYE